MGVKCVQEWCECGRCTLYIVQCNQCYEEFSVVTLKKHKNTKQREGPFIEKAKQCQKCARVSGVRVAVAGVQCNQCYEEFSLKMHEKNILRIYMVKYI